MREEQYPINCLPYGFIKKSETGDVVDDVIKILQTKGRVSKSEIKPLIGDTLPARIMQYVRGRGYRLRSKTTPGIETTWFLINNENKT